MRIGILAGEKSADNIGADFMHEFRQLAPDVTFVGCGGSAMLDAGLDRLDIDLEFFGLVEVVRHLPTIFRNRRKVIDFFLEQKIDAFIGIDLPDFNIGVEEALQKQGIKTVHYVSPTVWAWRKKRTVRFLKANNLVLCLYPFEPVIYANPRAVFVGHPMATSIPDDSAVQEARDALALEAWIAKRTVMALLPGSRRSEVKRLLVAFIETAKLCYQKKASLCVIISAANQQRFEQIQASLAGKTIAFDYRVVTGRNREVIAAADQVLVASGTATLETLLIKRPMVIAYQVHWLTGWLVRKLLTQEFGALLGQPNILAGRQIVPEFMQSDVQPHKLAQACLQQIEEDTAGLYSSYAAIHKTLKRPTGIMPSNIVLHLLSEEKVA